MIRFSLTGKVCRLCPAWEKTVVSGHTTRARMQRAGGTVFQDGCFVAPSRITLSAEIDHGGPLYAVILPEQRIISQT